MLVSLCLFLNLSLVHMFASAATPVSFALQAKDEGNDTVTVTVNLPALVENAGGIQFSLSYDTASFNYVAGSRKILLRAISDSDANRDAGANGTVLFAADRSSGFTVTGDIVSFQFDVLSEQAGNKAFTLTIQEFYYLDSTLSSVPLTSRTVTASISAGNTAVQEVEALIDAIGSPITLQSEADITAARQAYNALSIQHKRQVSNFDTLTAAEAELARLKSESSDSEDEQAAAAYRRAHSVILSRTVETLTLADKTLLETALEDYAEQSLNVRILLNPDKNLLNRLNTRMKELEQIEQDKLEEERLKQEAAEMAEAFRKQWKSFIDLEVSKVTDQHLTGITQAIGNADSNAMFNSYFLPLIKTEYDHLLALKEAAENYQGNASSPDEVAAAKFLSSYGYLLYMDAKDVTRDEEVDVRTALAWFDVLSGTAQQLIGDETRTHLEALLKAIEALPEDENAPTVITPDPEIIYQDREVIKEVMVPGESAGETDTETALVNVVTKGMTPAVWWLLGTLLATLLLSGAAAVILVQLKKKEAAITEKEEA